MADKSSIEWTDATWNPTRGCTEVAPGCAHCYAKVFAERFRGVPGHPYEQGFDPRLAPDKLAEPLKWKKPRKIFVDSMSDLFHEEFPFEYIAACFGVMAAANHHTYQILTKRPERAAEFFRWVASMKLPTITLPYSARLLCAVQASERIGRQIGCLSQLWPLPNVWIGTSIANQTDADKNIPQLFQIQAAVRFLSIEPLIGPIDLTNIDGVDYLAGHDFESIGDIRDFGDLSKTEHPRPLDWLIVGGESGHGARPCNVGWIRSIVAQCKAAGVPVFVKQLGSNPLCLCGCGEALQKGEVRLRDRKGGDWSEWPESVRVREFPREVSA